MGGDCEAQTGGVPTLRAPQDPATPLLGMDPEELKPGYGRDTCTLTFIAALFTIAKTRKTDEWIKKMWYTHTMEYYSANKKNEILFVTTWVDLEGIMLSDINRTQGDK